MRPLPALCVLLMLCACGQSMQTQDKLRGQGTTNAWPSGHARTLPEGTVAIGDAQYRAQENQAPKATPALLARGRERYDIFCSECHGYTGVGDGMVVQRGYPRPPSLLNGEAMTLSATRIVGIISNGKGIMFPYAPQIPPPDRWAIVAYVRALQLSQHPRAQSSSDGGRS